MSALGNGKSRSCLAWLLTQNMARNRGHLTVFSKFRDQNVFVVSKPNQTTAFCCAQNGYCLSNVSQKFCCEMQRFPTAEQDSASF